MANGDWDWLGPVAGAFGVGLGAAGSVIIGAWKFLSRLAQGRAEEEIRALENRVLVLETEWKAERETAERDRKELRETLKEMFAKVNETAEDAAATRALIADQRRR